MSELQLNHPTLCTIINHKGTETEEEIRNFAKKRGLHLTNWMLTRAHLIRGQEITLSHV